MEKTVTGFTKAVTGFGEAVTGFAKGGYRVCKRR